MLQIARTGSYGPFYEFSHRAEGIGIVHGDVESVVFVRELNIEGEGVVILQIGRLAIGPLNLSCHVGFFVHNVGADCKPVFHFGVLISFLILYFEVFPC